MTFAVSSSSGGQAWTVDTQRARSKNETAMVNILKCIGIGEQGEEEVRARSGALLPSLYTSNASVAAPLNRLLEVFLFSDGVKLHMLLTALAWIGGARIDAMSRARVTVIGPAKEAPPRLSAHER